MKKNNSSQEKIISIYNKSNASPFLENNNFIEPYKSREQ